ncbi:LOW QUALITY PROTEIN: hypothetical protein CRUP_038675 [Coryphaenoides rupestris]|nr:LOW QUALITY PROTEIN: hypothetical protein CRUP_038675 [Coryphaenoides rupestris]
MVVRQRGQGVLAGVPLARVLRQGSQKTWLHGCVRRAWLWRGAGPAPDLLDLSLTSNLHRGSAPRDVLFGDLCSSSSSGGGGGGGRGGGGGGVAAARLLMGGGRWRAEVDAEPGAGRELPERRGEERNSGATSSSSSSSPFTTSYSSPSDVSREDDSNATSGGSPGAAAAWWWWRRAGNATENGSAASGSPAAWEAGVDVTLSYPGGHLAACCGRVILFSAFGNAVRRGRPSPWRGRSRTWPTYLIGFPGGDRPDGVPCWLRAHGPRLYQVLNKWTLGQTMCEIFISLDVLCLHLVHSGTSLDRYCGNQRTPSTTVNKRTPRRAAILIRRHLADRLLHLHPAYVGLEERGGQGEPDACTISQDPEGFGVSPALFHKKSQRRGLEVEHGTTGLQQPNSPCVNGTATGAARRRRRSSSHGGYETVGDSNKASGDVTKKKNRAGPGARVKTLGIIMGTFIVFAGCPSSSWRWCLPFCAEGLLHARRLMAVINWLGYSNSLLNPIIYAYFNKDFQSAFKKIMNQASFRTYPESEARLHRQAVMEADQSQG